MSEVTAASSERTIHLMACNLRSPVKINSGNTSLGIGHTQQRLLVLIVAAVYRFACPTARVFIPDDLIGAKYVAGK
jgi:hypothetical protein